MFNARSLCNKLPHLHAILSIDKPDFLFVTETWLSSKILDTELLLSFPYRVFRSDRARRGGGVCLFIRDHLPCSRVSLPSRISSDILVVDVYSPTALIPTRFVLVYRPPNTTTVQNTSLFDLISSLFSVQYQVVVLGDFNLHINWKSPGLLSSQSSCLYDLSIDLALSQVVPSPSLNGHFLDVILSPPDIISDCRVSAPFRNADHSSIDFKFSFPLSHPILVHTFDFRKTDFSGLDNALYGTDWEAILSDFIDVSDLYDRFVSYLTALFNRFVPLRKCSLPSDHYPPHIKSLLSHKRSLFDKISLRPVHAQFIRVSRKLDYEIRKYVRSYENRLLAGNHSRSFYRYVSTRFKSKGLVIPAIIAPDGSVVTCPSKKAESLADYFTSVYTSDDGTVPTCPSLVSQSIPVSIILPHEVASHLSRVSSSCSLPSDNIPSIIFKKCFASLSTPLAHIFNYSLMLGTIPSLWKSSIVVPIPKVASPSSVSDFRPISLTPIPAKIMERLLKPTIIDWCTSHNVIPMVFSPGVLP
jgi:Endonuclease-reverse transcriptase